MALADAVQGATRPQQQITWTDADGDAVNLTGATITAIIRDRTTFGTAASTGTLALTTPASGVFTWTYGSADVATAGVYDVQFTASYSGTPTPERTLIEKWVVHHSL